VDTVRRNGAGAALLLGACAITAITAALILTRSSHPVGTATMTALGGLALAAGGPAAPVIAATAIGALAIFIAAAVVPEHITVSPRTRAAPAGRTR
jgi:hypothetical protein